MAEHSDAAEQIDERTPPDDDWPTWGQQLAAMSADLAANIR
jgi:hypothetical protein